MAFGQHQMRMHLAHKSHSSSAAWASQGSPEVTSEASLPFTGPRCAAIGLV